MTPATQPMIMFLVSCFRSSSRLRSASAFRSAASRSLRSRRPTAQAALGSTAVNTGSPLKDLKQCNTGAWLFWVCARRRGGA